MSETTPYWTSIMVSREIHRLVKIHAAVLGEGMSEYVEKAVRSRLAGTSVAMYEGMLLDSREEAVAEHEVSADTLP